MKVILIFLGICFCFGVVSQPKWSQLPSHPNQQSFEDFAAEVSDSGKINLFFSSLDNGSLHFFRSIFDFQSYSWSTNSIIHGQTQNSKIISKHFGEHLFIAFFDHNGTNKVLRVYQFTGTTSSFSSDIILPNNTFVDFDLTLGEDESEVFVAIATHDSEFLFSRRAGATMTPPISISSPTINAQTIKEIEVDYGDDKVFVLLRDTLNGQGANQFHNHLYQSPDDIINFSACGGFGGTMQTTAADFFRSGANELIVDDNKVLVAGYNTQGSENQEWTFSSTLNDYNVNSANMPFRPDIVGASASNDTFDFYFSLTKENGADTPFPRVYFRNSLGVWSDFAGAVTTYVPTFEEAHISISQNSKHVLVSFENNGNFEFYISNRVPTAGIANAILSHCENSNNSELYSGVGFVDQNGDSLWITGFDVQLGQGVSSSNFSSAFIGKIGLQTFFKVFLSNAPATTISGLRINVFDGYDTASISMPEVFIVNSVGALPAFVNGPLKFCSNAPQVVLKDFVNSNAIGRFYIDQTEVPFGVITNNNLQNMIGQGDLSLTYRELRDGCLISIDSLISVVEPTGVSLSVTDASSCVSSDGEISAIFSPSTPSQLFWSNGMRNINTISSLPSGQYFISFEDANGCKVRKGAFLKPGNELTISATSQDVSCFNGTDGQVNLSISTNDNYSVLWSNGSEEEDQTALRAGLHQVKIKTENGCLISREFIISQPENLIASSVVTAPTCGNDDGNISLSIQGGTPPYNVVWNGITIGNPLNNVGFGIDTAVITDSRGCEFTVPVSVSEQGSASLSGIVKPSTCETGDGEIDVTIFPVLGEQVSSISWSNGEMTEDISDLLPNSYICTATMSNGCKAVKTWNVDQILPKRIEVCAVTVDLSTTSNLIVWEKINLPNIHHFNLYRESNLPGDYHKIGQVMYDSLTVFNDVVAEPLERSWRYIISAVDSCGTESAYSLPHKSMQLLARQVGNDYQLDWDEYEGVNFGQFYVYRKVDNQPWDLIDSTTNVEYLDVNIPSSFNEIDYYVHIGLETPCVATFKAEDFRYSRSNRTRGVFNPGSGTGHQNNDLWEGELTDYVSLFPNPFSENIEVRSELNDLVKVTILDYQGREIGRHIIDSEGSINSKTWTSGVYFVLLESAGLKSYQKLIKQ